MKSEILASLDRDAATTSLDCRRTVAYMYHFISIPSIMAQFRAKKLDLGCFVNIMNIRDHTKRKVFEQNEPERYGRSCAISFQWPLELQAKDGSLTLSRYRQALRYVIRNTTLPQRTRAQAQLQLSQMHCYTRPTQIRNRCIMGGKGRGVLKDFRMARVCGGR